jgi:leucyl/phenylalanyl-tRNA--protein transferase
MSIITPEGEQRPTQKDFFRIAGEPDELCPFMVLFQFAHGAFPWHEHQGRTLWWNPEPRCVLIPNEIHISRSLAKTIRKGKYEVRADTDFEAVIRACAMTRTPTWITEQMIQVMLRLHRLGHAHSIETWELDPNGDHQKDQLVGGFYGVAVGRVFFGESMFSHVPDASKIALVKASEILSKHGFPFIDCQLGSPHLVRMGARFMPREIFRELVVRFANGPRHIGSWEKMFNPGSTEDHLA